VNLICLIKGHKYSTEVLGGVANEEGAVMHKFVAISCKRCRDIKKVYWLKDPMGGILNDR